ncbi:ribokinase [Marisediminicola sp. LYQ134]|uniref:ribokinase n=1 Tax=Marisediminicola sp. LYQ134 TaxID=3391061 RepID=UPI0039831A28
MTTNGASDARVIVVGSANTDTVFSVDRAPRPGETVLAGAAAEHPGGKGLNQAVAAARAGARVAFVGALGRDERGDALESVMAADMIDSTLVRRTEHPTGQAFIVVDASGENSIVVASGANATVTALTDADGRAIRAARVLVLQLELPLAAVEAAARVASAAGTLVVLNAAPAMALGPDTLESVDVLVVNEHEALVVSGLDDLDRAVAALSARVRRLVVTLGSAGSVLVDSGVEVARIAAHRVSVVDSTGAGDTFCGAFAAALAEADVTPQLDVSPLDLERAARFATVAAALSVTVAGAVPSIPARADILEAMS